MREKIEKLKKYIHNLKSAVVAFSGGVDSSLLAKIAYDALGDSAVAATAVSELVPRQEVDQSRKIAQEIGIKQYLLTLNLLEVENIRDNPRNRCYWCKQNIFSNIGSLQQQLRFNHIIEGSNVDDLNSYRPGIRALEEMKVLSPLARLGFTKEEVRQCAGLLGLSNYNLPSAACLASRIPYGQKLDARHLNQIALAEQYIKKLGFEVVRVRYHHPVARIELQPDKLPQLFKNQLNHKIHDYLTGLGFNYITIDLAGFRSGSMDENL
ncbi:MAG: ATP-dependent sacrificial sulfur transferase LarE [Actinomycetota bacterium]|nr:ATP-dependent sacrificial sulfur transferase LarE [Actinomycetota bacterium]